MDFLPFICRTPPRTKFYGSNQNPCRILGMRHQNAVLGRQDKRPFGTAQPQRLRRNEDRIRLVPQAGKPKVLTDRLLHWLQAVIDRHHKRSPLEQTDGPPSHVGEHLGIVRETNRSGIEEKVRSRKLRWLDPCEKYRSAVGTRDQSTVAGRVHAALHVLKALEVGHVKGDPVALADQEILDRIGAVALTVDEGIGTFAALDRVVAPVARNDVVAIAGVDEVIAVTARNCIGLFFADDFIVTVAAAQEIRTFAARKGVVPGTSLEAVVSFATVELVIAIAAVEGVVARVAF